MHQYAWANVSYLGAPFIDPRNDTKSKICLISPRPPAVQIFTIQILELLVTTNPDTYTGTSFPIIFNCDNYLITDLPDLPTQIALESFNMLSATSEEVLLRYAIKHNPTVCVSNVKGAETLNSFVQ